MSSTSSPRPEEAALDGPAILRAAARIMDGEMPATEFFRRVAKRCLVEVAPDAAVVICRGLSANVTVLRTPAGLLLCDTGSVEIAPRVFEAIRDWDATAPVHTVLFTHGHFDHVNGIALWEDEARRLGRAVPRVIGHANIRRRFQRYVRTAELNRAINRRQYSRPDFPWPLAYRDPDVLVHDRLDIKVGDESFELNHARGETDDHLWLWSPSRRLIVAGDFVMWAAPNAGNPQKAQRYAGDWALALRDMLSRGADTLIPGHGPPVLGRDRIERYLDTAAQWLESLEDQTLERLNAGARLDEILHTVRVPESLARLPWLQANYDDPEFVVRGIVRLYGGWWDGNPANLKPAPDVELAGEVARLAGGAGMLCQRARELMAGGQLRLAGHIAEFAAIADPASAMVQATRAAVNRARVAAESSQMAKGIFRAAAEESEAKLRPPGGEP